MSHSDELACARLASLWAHYIDRHQVEAVVALFAEEGILHGHGGAVLKGRAAIANGLSRRDSDRVTRHVLAPPVVRLVGESKAECVAEYVLFDGYKSQHPGREILPIQLPLAVGEFHQTYERSGDEWLISAHRGISIFRQSEN